MQLWSFKSEYEPVRNSKFKMQRYRNGFTLIELLVAISIIGILSSFLLANFVGVRQRVRDGVRKSDLRQIQSALELYRSDQGSYPASGSKDGDFPTTCGTSVSFTDAKAKTTYMQKVPCDPSSGSSYTYSPVKNTTYSIIACLENGNDAQKDAKNTKPCDGTTNFSYTLQNP